MRIIRMVANGVKLLPTVLVGLVFRDLPPEGLVMLAEPPPGTGRVPPDIAADQARITAIASLPSRRRRRVRRKPVPVSSVRTPPTPPG